MKYAISLLSILFAICFQSMEAKELDIGLILNAEYALIEDTIPRPPQVVTTYPSSVSDEVLLGSDSLKSGIGDMDISFGAGISASAKIHDEIEDVSNAALLIELQALRKEVAELREEVKGLRRKKKGRRKF